MKIFFKLAFLPLTVASVFGQNGWINLGPNGGLIDAVVADQTAPGTLLAGTQTGDFYRSLNDGQSWSYLSALPIVENQAIERLIIDSSNGQRIYAATGNQIYSSSDGGTTWIAAANSEVQEVFDMAISPVNSSQLYAAASDRIWRSLNYGLSWSAVYEAEDTVQITALAFAPDDPQNRFLMGLQTDGGLSQVVGTHDGGVNTNPVFQLPLDWIVAKIFVADDPNSTITALIGSDDSTKIIRSVNDGQSWTIVYASPNPLMPGGIGKLTFCNWLAWKDDNANQILGTTSGILQTTNNGATWFKLSYYSEIFTTTLARSPSDQSVLYGRAVGQGSGLSKILINPGGSLSFTDINYGLTATKIEHVFFADGNDLIMTSNTNELLISQNGGFDFTRFGLGQNNQVMTAYRSRLDQAYYWIMESGMIFRSETGISSQIIDSVSFPPLFDRVLSAAVLNYYDETTNNDSTLLIVSVGSESQTTGAVLISVDDGTNWIPINFGGPFSTTIPRQVSVDQTAVIPLYASNEQAIFRQMYRGAPTWAPSFVAPTGHSITKFASRFGYFLFVLSRTPLSTQRLDASFFDPEAGIWESFDITYTLDQIDPSGNGQIEDIYAGDDASYLLYRYVNGQRKLFKATFYADIVWHDITESPLDQLNVRSIIDDNDYEDQSFNLYAAADNGIWLLKQTAILSQDSVVTSPATSINIQDTSFFEVSYRNDGAAVAVVDSFRITGDVFDEFGFADPYFYQTTLPYPLDLRSTSHVLMYFAPTRFGARQALLTAYYRGRSSRGVDSVFALTTRMIGTTKASRINTGLRGDTLDMSGTLVYGSKTSSLSLGNSGNDTLYVFDIRITNGQYFGVEAPPEIAIDGFLAIPPNQSEAIPVSFSPQEAGPLADSMVIVSSAHHYLTNAPDSEHVVTLVGMGSNLQVTNLGSLRPQLGQNQGITINLSIAQIVASEVSSTLHYRHIGKRSQGFSHVPFTPVGPSAFVATIPQDDITQNGLEFYIETTGSTAQGNVSLYFPDASRSDSTYALAISVPRPGLGSSGYLTLPGGTRREAFQLVSFPISLNNPTPQGAFSESNLGQIGDQGNWQLYRYSDPDFRWIRATDTDVSFGNIESGKSYLVITRESRTLNSGAGKTMTPDRAVVDVTPGWNMIANPYAFSIHWLDVALYNDGIEYGNIVVLQNGRFRYVEDSELAALKLEPWKGYLYYSPPDSGAFTLYYPAVWSDGLAKPSNPGHGVRSNQPSPGEYILDIMLSYDGVEDSYRVGELADALESRDYHDKAPVPVLGTGDIILTLADGLHSDFRPVSEQGRYWDFTVHSTEGTIDGSLRVAGTELLPADFEAVLIDRDRNKLMDIENSRLRATPRETHYRLIVGTASFIEKSRSELIPTSFYLDRNFPNPFNPTTLIRYGLPTDARVSLTVYNILGQTVRTLISETLPAATYSVIWDGLTDSGRPCASGVYIYRIQAVSVDGSRRFSHTNKMTLLK